MKITEEIREMLEGMARTIENLLEELRRRGATYDGDREGYDEYRKLFPKEDA